MPPSTSTGRVNSAFSASMTPRDRANSAELRSRARPNLHLETRPERHSLAFRAISASCGVPSARETIPPSRVSPQIPSDSSESPLASPFTRASKGKNGGQFGIRTRDLGHSYRGLTGPAGVFGVNVNPVTCGAPRRANRSRARAFKARLGAC
jgi:hypothetical protein